MPVSSRIWLASVVALAIGWSLYGQHPAQDDLSLLVPKKPPSRRELDHCRALELYARALLNERRDRLLEATRLLEKAVQLDPDAASLHRSLVPLYLAADRVTDALAECRKTLKLNPDDEEIGYLYARQLKQLGRPDEAAKALARAVKSPALKDEPELRAAMYFDLALLYEETPNFEQAEAAFRQVIQALAQPRPRPEAATVEGPVNLEECYEHIIKLGLQNQRYDRALAAFAEAKARGLARRPGRLNELAAQAYFASGKLRQALDQLNAYLKTLPAETEAYELRNTVLKQLGRGQDVLPSLQEAAQNDPHNLALQLLLARQYALDQQPSRAEQLYLELTKENPSPDIYRGLFKLYLDQGRMSEALTQLNQAIHKADNRELGGDLQEALRARAMLVVLRDSGELGRALVDAGLRKLAANQPLEKDTVHFLAVVAGRNRQLDAAETFYRNCLKFGLTERTESEVYFGLIEVLWQAHKRNEVIQVCRQGLKEAGHTDRRIFHFYLAQALVAVGKADEAIAEADEYVKFTAEPEQGGARRIRALILARAGRFDKAVAECQGLLRATTEPKALRDIHYTLSNIYDLAHQLDKAEAELRWVVHADPTFATADNDLGYILADQGKNLPEAEELIRKAIQLDRQRRKTGVKITPEDDHDNAAYIDSLGWVLFRRGKFEAARSELEKAVALPDGNDDPVVWDHLGDVCFRLNNVAKAKTCWRKAVALYEAATTRRPDKQYKEIRHKLQLLQTKPKP